MQLSNQRSRLVLGTVQFGLDYGISNRSGQPARASVFAILDRALDWGVMTLDTASAYGEAEEVLGEYIRIRGKVNDIRIVSKLRPNIARESGGNTFSIIVSEVQKSFKRLGVDVLDGYLLHDPGDIRRADVMDALRECKARGMVRNIGVSTYEVEDCEYAIEQGGVDYVQVPFSVFDQRVLKKDLFARARKKGVRMFGRSIFLQGLLFLSTEQVPEHLTEAKEYLGRLDAIIKPLGLSRMEAALLFVWTLPDPEYVVLGVDSLKQLNEIFHIIEASQVSQGDLQGIVNLFDDANRNVILPNLWTKPDLRKK